jgi:predicted transcriptional regulator
MDSQPVKKKTVRSCYGHLGGKTGEVLFTRLIELGWFEKIQEKSTVYEITPKGLEELDSLGVKLD